MGKPWFGIENHFFIDGITVPTSSENENYSGGNLKSKHLWPGWRSGSRPLWFDGVNDFLFTEDNQAFDIADDLTLYCTFMVTDLSMFRPLIYKISGGEGYWLLVGKDGNLFLRGQANSASLDSSTATGTIEVNKWYQVIVSKSGTTVRIWINGVEAPVSGENHVALGASTANVNIGNGAGNKFQGYIQECGIGNVSVTDWHVYNSSTTGTVSYWYLDNWSGNSILDSRNDRNLTFASPNPATNVYRKGIQWFAKDHNTSDTVDTAVIDRRHNLSTGTVVTMARGGWWAPQYSFHSRQFATVKADSPVVFQYAFGDHPDYWFQFFDDDLLSESYEIPMVYLGQKKTLSRSFLRGFKHRLIRMGTTEALAGGDQSHYLTSEKRHQYELTFLCDTDDREIIESAIETCAEGYPIVFCPDSDTPEKAIFCRIENPLSAEFGNAHPNLDEIHMTLTETG